MGRGKLRQKNPYDKLGHSVHQQEERWPGHPESNQAEYFSIGQMELEICCGG